MMEKFKEVKPFLNIIITWLTIIYRQNYSLYDQKLGMTIDLISMIKRYHLND